jgi:hypothetical protein
MQEFNSDINQEASTRKQFNIVMFGGNGCGKTTKLLEVIDAYLDANEWKRVLIITPDDSEEKLEFIEEIQVEDLRTFKGLKKLIVSNAKIFTTLKDVYLPHAKSDKANSIKFNGLLVVDDAGVILDRRNEEVLDFFRRRRQANVDILTIFHGLRNEVPPSFFAYVTDLIIFQTADNHKKTLDLLPMDKQESFMTAYTRVQSCAKQNPYYCEQLKLREI